MAHSFEQSKDHVAQLVKHFLTNKATYTSLIYKEAQARHEFIDNLFIALNWDVRNHQHAAPDYREVIIEDSLDIEGQKKAPDYAFRVGRERKFFAEAKKPGVDLKNTTAPAYQLRRYAWSAKLPLSILTDFEEFAVYDCRIRPGEKDKSSVARINYLRCEEYADRWCEVWDVFSRDAVWSGSFDQFAIAGKNKRGTSEVDAEFLKEIERWRDVLAKNIALRNPHLTIDELNDAVQRMIDRIIFLRMAEDRGIEDYGQLQKIANLDDAYSELISLSRKADAKYNSGLFDFSKSGDLVTPLITVDDKALRPILSGLYYPQSPYEFSVLPAEILGNVYEQFLGKVIRLTPAHQAKVEEKPAVKKAGGVYYTPSYIVEYIVRNTVGKQIEGKNPKQLRGYRVLDMACGSGSFLLGAYQHLLDHYQRWYAEHSPEKHGEAVWQHGDSWRLTTAEKKRILTEHIFGIDIDRQAVEVTKLSLQLKVLEGENHESFGKQLALMQERALPNLDRNIQCGNSLIDPDYFAGEMLPDEEELRRVNPFDWQRAFPDAMQSGGFDCVIGNPPYIRIQTMKEWAATEVEIYKRLYASARAGNYDIYVVFVERALQLLNKHGRMGFILPHKFFNAQYGEALRGLIADNRFLHEVVHFGDQQVFAGATTYTCLLFLDKAENDKVQVTKVTDVNSWRITGAATTGTITASNITAAEWNFTVGKGAALFERLSRMPVKLGDVAERMAQGIRTSANEVYVLDVVSSNDNFMKAYSKQLDREVKLERDSVTLFLQGREIKPYRILPSGKVVIIPYSVRDEKTEFVAPKEMQAKFPKTFEYLSENKSYLENREHGRMKTHNWYAYVTRRILR